MTKKRSRYKGIEKLTDGRVRIRSRAIDPKTGKEREIDRVVSASMEEAVRLQAAWREQIRQSATRSAEVPRLTDFATSWLRSKIGELKASTAETYAIILDTRVLPGRADGGLGDLFLDKITTQDVRDWRDALAHRLSPSSVNGSLIMVKMVLGDAAAEYGFANPAERVSRLRVRGYTGDDPNLLSASELGLFLDVVRLQFSDYYPLILTLALTGLRFGEATALKWHDVDEDAGLIRVERAQWKGIIDTTKTGRRRSVPLVPELAEVLAQHRAGLLASQAPGLESGWVFPGPGGDVVTKDELRWGFTRAVKAAKMKRRFTVHGLRRTLNNLSRQVAGEIVTRSITGHVSSEMTQHYSHVGSEEKLKAAGTIVSLVPGLRKAGA